MKPIALELSISSPQPRLNEIFYLSLEISDLEKSIFGALVEKVEPKNEIISSKNGITTIKVSTYVKAKQNLSVSQIGAKIGKFEAGPLAFELNGVKYTTNKVCYEVINQLPNVDKGLWFRKTMIDKKLFCIIIEQREPKVRKAKGESISMTNEAQDFSFVKLKTFYLHPIAGLKFKQGSSSANENKLVINGKTKSFIYNYSISHFEIVDPTAQIKLTKENFDNLPKDYDFEDIVIQ